MKISVGKPLEINLKRQIYTYIYIYVCIYILQRIAEELESILTSRPPLPFWTPRAIQIPEKLGVWHFFGRLNDVMPKWTSADWPHRFAIDLPSIHHRLMLAAAAAAAAAAFSALYISTAPPPPSPALKSVGTVLSLPKVIPMAFCFSVINECHYHRYDAGESPIKCHQRKSSAVVFACKWTGEMSPRWRPTGLTPPRNSNLISEENDWKQRCQIWTKEKKKKIEKDSSALLGCC